MTRPRLLILTRPAAQSADFAAALEAALPGRFEVIAAPVIGIEPLPGAVDLAGVGALAFTSANGVAQFAAREPTRTLPAFCVGETTASAARREGFVARSADGDVAALAALIAAARPSGEVLHVRGRHAAGDLVARLTGAGVTARAAEVYAQVELSIGGAAATALAAGRAGAVAFFSPRSAALFAVQARTAAWDLSGVAAVSLSRVADSRLDSAQFGRRLVAAHPDRQAMIAALAEL